MLLGVALRAQGGVGIACGVWWAVCGGSLWGLLAVLWAGAEECGRWEALQVLSDCCLLPAACCLLPAALLMTSTDRNDLMPAQEKLEWITPKISLMGADKTAGAKQGMHTREIQYSLSSIYGPS